MTLQALNRAVCALTEQAAADSGTGAKVVAEDLDRPILRPSAKVELEDSSEARATAGLVEVQVTFRIYFFARDKHRPKLENLSMRSALGRAFRDGIPVGEEVVPIDEGLAFTVTDGVLVASLNLSIDLEPAEPDGELMESLSQRFAEKK